MRAVVVREFGAIENATLASPDQVAGLREFLLALTVSPVSMLHALPNPARAAMRFVAPETAGLPPARLEVFDLAGRRVASLEPVAVAVRVEWGWDGRDASGRSLPPGMLLARVRGSSAPALRITRLP